MARGRFGYGQELARARSSLRAHPLLLVEGLKGAGKTSFLQNLARHLGSRRRALTLWVAAQPEWSLENLLNEIGGGLSGFDRASREDGDVPIEARLVSMIDVLERHSASLLIDDCDPIDPGGAELLVERFMSRLSRARVVISSGRHLRLRLPYETECPRIVLRALAQEDAARLTIGIFKRSGAAPPPAEAVRAVCERAHGHPPLIEYIAAALIERGACDAEAVRRWGTIAADWAESPIAEIVRGLGEADRAFLRAAACFRLPVPRDGLAAVAGETTVAELLPPLVERFLVEPRANDRFAPHPLVREYCSLCLPWDLAPRREAHLAAARFCKLLGLKEGFPWMAEAHHHLLEAGEAEQARTSFLEMLPTLRREGRKAATLALARATARALGRPDPEVLLVEADVLLDGFRLEEAGEVVAKLEPLAHSPGLGPRIQLTRGRLLMMGEGRSEARAVLEESLRGFERVGEGRGMVEALGALARWHVRQGDSTEALAAGVRGVERAKEAGDREQLALSLHALADVHLRLGRADEAEPLYERARRIDEEDHRGVRVVAALRQLASIRTKLGRPADAIRLCERGLERAREENDEVAQAMILEALAECRFRGGRADLALPLIEEALRLFDAKAHTVGKMAARWMLAVLRAEIGDLAVAEALTRQVIDELRTAGDQWGVHVAMTNLAHILSFRGDHAGALELSERARRFLSAGGRPRELAVALLHGSLSLGAVGRLEEAREDCLEALRAFERLNLPPRVCTTKLFLASFEYRLGRLAEAAGHCRDSIESAPGNEADRGEWVLAYRLLDAIAEAQGAEEEASVARRAWTEEFNAAPPITRDRIARYARLLALHFPNDFVIRTGHTERPASILDIHEISHRSSGFALVIDIPGKRVSRADAGSIDLSRCPILFRLLSFLASRPGTPLSREAILHGVWGYSAYDPLGLRRLIDFNIHRLRAAIEPDPRRPTYVKSLRGKGKYFFDAGARYCLCDHARERSKSD